jgi:hypothetical protein
MCFKDLLPPAVDAKLHGLPDLAIFAFAVSRASSGENYLRPGAGVLRNSAGASARGVKRAR